MLQQLHIDSKLGLSNEDAYVCLGRPVHVVVNEFDDATVRKIQEAISHAKSINQSILPITIDSYGGEAYSVAAMIDLILATDLIVATVVIGKAMSCGSILSAFGTIGYRFAAPSSNIMVHGIKAGAYGNTEDLKVRAHHIDNLDKYVYNKLALHCGHKDKNYFIDMMKKKQKADWHLTPKDAVKHKLIDNIGIPTFSVDIDVKYGIR